MKKQIISIILIIILLQTTSLSYNASSETINEENITKNYEIPLDQDFIFEITQKLTGIIKQKDENGNFKYWQGRDFGTPGEREAARILKEEIWDEHIAKDNSDISNATLDSVEGIDNIKKIGVESQNDYNLKLYCENKIIKPKKSEYFPLHSIFVKEHNFTNAKICLAPNWAYNLEENTDQYFLEEKQDSNEFLIYLIELDKCKKMPIYQIRGDYCFYDVINFLRLRTRFDAYLLADHINETHFMTPFQSLVPGISINGRLGNRIREKIENNKSINADFFINTKELFVESYNVIGTIDGMVDEIVMIGAHYDSMWCQGACDDSCSVSIVFSIAKYFADNNIKPYYTLKFAAWAGEEYPTRQGSESYVLKNKKNEKYRAYINFGPTGYKNNNNIQKSEIPLFLKHTKKITSDIKMDLINKNYSEMSGGYGDLTIKLIDSYIAAVDACSFIGYSSKGIYSFEKGFYRTVSHFYHRDGQNHTKGDSEDIIDFDDVYATAQLGLLLVKKYSDESNSVDKNKSSVFFKNYPIFTLFEKFMSFDKLRDFINKFSQVHN